MGQFNSIVFPAPKSSYTKNDFPQFILVPNNNSKTFTDIPCLHQTYSFFSDTLLFFHGNCEDIGTTYEFANNVSKAFKLNLVVPEYQGYGIHKGTPSEKAILHDSELVYRFLINEMNIPENKIIIFGRSIGTGPSVFLASKFSPKALILMSAFSSIKNVAADASTILSVLVSDGFRNIDLIKKVKCPKLLIHGKKDRIIPFHHSETLRDESPEKTDFWLSKEMKHNKFDLVPDVLVPIDNFFKKYSL